MRRGPRDFDFYFTKHNDMNCPYYMLILTSTNKIKL